MNNQTLPMTELSCKRCGYGWMPRTRTPPEVCPNCKSRRWDMPPNAETATEDLTPAQRRSAEQYIRILKYGDRKQLRALQLIVAGQAALLKPEKAKKA